MNSWTIPRTIFVVAVLMATTACAVFHSPFAPPASESHASLSLEALRADPDGLTLALRAQQAQPGDELQIWHRDEGRDWSQAQSISVDETMVSVLETGQLHWRDAIDATPAALRYRIELIGEDHRLISSPVDIDWNGWPPRPDASAESMADAPSRISLQWDDTTGYEARIMRRDILADAPFEALAIVDAAAGGRFVDDGVSPGGVYAYRLQFIDRLSPYPRSGPYTEPIYVSVPEEQ